MKSAPFITNAIYLSGMLLYLVSLLLPAYSPLGAWNQSGWDALKFVLDIEFDAVKKINNFVQVLNFAILILSAMNNLLVVASIGLFPIRHYFNNNLWFKVLLIGGILSLAYVTVMLLMVEEIVLRYGFYLWGISIALIYVSFHPKLSSDK